MDDFKTQVKKVKTIYILIFLGLVVLGIALDTSRSDSQINDEQLVDKADPESQTD